jgi:hypothetical protein
MDFENGSCPRLHYAPADDNFNIAHTTAVVAVMGILAADSISEFLVDDRYSRRRAITHEVALVVRRGHTGVGPNLAISLVDANPDGLGLELNAPVTFGDVVEVEFTPPGASKPLKLVADVRWCMAAGDGTFRAGIKLRRRLTPTDIANLTG